jgi:hypothetical protein
VLQECLCCHQHPRGAETALNGPFLNEGFLHWMKLRVLGQAFHCLYARPCDLLQAQQTGALCFAIHNDGARSAVPLATAILGSS